MSSFDKMAVWPVGYLRATTSWLMRNRKEVAARIDTTRAEIQRIGFVKVSYRTIPNPLNGANEATEERVGISVTQNSSLGKLLQAYIANGGNPFDISPFLHANGTVSTIDASGQAITATEYPHGGIIAPQSAENYSDRLEIPINGIDTGFGPYPGGWLNTARYYAKRQGGRRDKGQFDSDTVVKGMHLSRKWANQEIKERLQNAEWQIIKLCDLQEQLIKEMEETLVQAFGGYLTGVTVPSENYIEKDVLAQNVIQTMYKLVFKTDGGDQVQALRANELVPLLSFTFDDDISELRLPMGC